MSNHKKDVQNKYCVVVDETIIKIGTVQECREYREHMISVNSLWDKTKRIFVGVLTPSSIATVGEKWSVNL